MAETTMRQVTFESAGEQLAGVLYIPKNHTTPVCGIVVTGTWTSVKEQMANRYAERLAEQGFAALSFDFRGYGESSGEPRSFESPDRKAEDIHAAITCLQAQSAVNKDKIGALGICAGAGYMLANAIQDARVKSLAMVAPWLHNADIIRGIYGGNQGVAERMKRGREARLKYETTGEVDYVPALSETDKWAAMPMKLDFYLDPTRGAIPEWPNQFAVMAWLDWLTYDPIRHGRDLAIPLQVVHSEQAATPGGVKAFYDLVRDAKDILWTDGQQIDFYDQDPQVGTAIERVSEHFRRTL